MDNIETPSQDERISNPESQIFGTQNPDPLIPTKAEVSALHELQNRYPNNPTYDTNFANIPAGLVSVYCIVPEERFIDIDNEGLISNPKNPLGDARARQLFDRELDKYAPNDVHRSGAYFAFPTETALRIKSGGGITKGVILEIKVDPEKVLVADQDLFSEVIAGYYKNHEKFDTDYPKAYWQKTMTLAQFHHSVKSGGEDYTEYYFPEVVISSSIPIGLIKAVGVVSKDTFKKESDDWDDE